MIWEKSYLLIHSYSYLELLEFLTLITIWCMFLIEAHQTFITFSIFRFFKL